MENLCEFEDLYRAVYLLQIDVRVMWYGHCMILTENCLLLSIYLFIVPIGQKKLIALFLVVYGSSKHNHLLTSCEGRIIFID